MALAAGGCHSVKKTTDEAALAAGVGAMVVVSPLVPVVEGVRAASIGPDRRSRLVRETSARLDPPTEQRIAAILARDPIADAQAVYESAGPTLLPSLPQGGAYPGLLGPKYDLQRFTQTSTSAPLFVSIEALTRMPSEALPTAGELAAYGGPVLMRFRDVAFAYKSAFNQEMYRLATR